MGIKEKQKCIRLHCYKSQAGSAIHIFLVFISVMGILTSWIDGQEKSNISKKIVSLSIDKTGSWKSQIIIENVCTNYLTVSICRRKKIQRAKIVMLALWGKDSVCTWVRVMVSAEKHPLRCTTATKSSMTDSKCPWYTLLLKNLPEALLRLPFCPKCNPVCSK